MSDVKEMPAEHTFHKLAAANGGPEHAYRVTHYIDADGKRTGKGFVEMEEDVEHGDGNIERKFRRVGASYPAFCEDVCDHEQRAQSRKDQDEASLLLEQKRAAEEAAKAEAQAAADEHAAQRAKDEE